MDRETQLVIILGIVVALVIGLFLLPTRNVLVLSVDSSHLKSDHLQRQSHMLSLQSLRSKTIFISRKNRKINIYQEHPSGLLTAHVTPENPDFDLVVIGNGENTVLGWESENGASWVKVFFHFGVIDD